jgi:phospholipid/cholesterol/gamma-HCH transport system permease protein
VIIGLIKPLLFGFLVATIGCYYGLTSRGGTQGVGRATTQAVVAASILILAVNYFTSQLLLYLLK